jgi:hypothetical protein
MNARPLSCRKNPKPGAAARRRYSTSSCSCEQPKVRGAPIKCGAAGIENCIALCRLDTRVVRLHSDILRVNRTFDNARRHPEMLRQPRHGGSHGSHLRSVLRSGRH